VTVPSAETAHKRHARFICVNCSVTRMLLHTSHVTLSDPVMPWFTDMFTWFRPFDGHRAAAATRFKHVLLLLPSLRCSHWP